MNQSIPHQRAILQDVEGKLWRPVARGVDRNRR